MSVGECHTVSSSGRYRFRNWIAIDVFCVDPCDGTQGPGGSSRRDIDVARVFPVSWKKYPRVCIVLLHEKDCIASENH